ncbi:MAG: uncharacterized protein KVP18_001388 [Porospora cf. gigantea A]|uniref:uncharacterized protein n=1 Tax=Porospora cf. gigantea A TaxID=2853593 RepID=UPI00355970A6|nr:MAG: hypothetical protein KVP18_001388 [Porospora cf. gigantea A]
MLGFLLLPLAAASSLFPGVVTWGASLSELNTFILKIFKGQGMLVIGTSSASDLHRAALEQVLGDFPFFNLVTRPHIPIASVRLDSRDHQRTLTLLTALLRMPVEFLQHDAIDRADDPVADGHILQGLRSSSGLIRLQGAWKITKGSPKVHVMIVDTRVDLEHPDLKGHFWNNASESSGVAGVDDDENGFLDDVHGVNPARRDGSVGQPLVSRAHGTHVAGICAGVAPQVQLVACTRGSRAMLADCAEYAIAHGVKIMNYSAGALGCCDPVYRRTFDMLASHGVVFVTTAGNLGLDLDVETYQPGSFPSSNVVTVAAADAHGRLPSWSGRGYRAVDIAAPGVNVVSCVPGGGRARMSGTSMAAPHVAGCLALMFSTNPNLSARDAKAILVETARPVPEARFATRAGGVLDCETAVLRTKDALSTSSTTSTAPMPPSEAGVVCEHARGERSMCGYCKTRACCDTLPLCVVRE